MTKSLNRLRLTAAVLGLVVGMANQTRADITITVTPSLAPNAYGSPSYSAYVSNAVTALETGATSEGTAGTPSYYQALANSGATIDASQDIVTGFSSWNGQADPGTAFAGEYGNRLLFGLSIVDTNADGTPGTFSISQLSFSATSTDSGDSLGFSFGLGSYNYSNEYVGVIYGVDGAPNQYITTGLNTQLVNAVYGRGSGNAYDVYSTDPGATDQDKIDNVVASIPGEVFTGTYSLTQSTGPDITGSGSVTIQADPNFNPTAVAPEPSTIAMIVSAVPLGLGYWLRRRKCK